MSYRDKIYKNYAQQFQGESYRQDNLVSRWAQVYGYYLRCWLPEHRDARIADVGCGGGQLLGALRLLGYTSLAGVDISEQQVLLAQRAGFQVEAGDAIEFLRRHAGAFDFITAIDVVEHLKKDEVMAFFENAFAALRPGGRLVLQMPNPNSVMGMRVRYGDFTHEVCLSPRAAERLLGLCRFEACESRETGPAPSWRSPGSIIRWMLWKIARTGLMAFDLMETAGLDTNVYTRVYLVSARRPH